MRDSTRVQMQLSIAPECKALIRRLARAEGRTMTRYVLRLVDEDARRRADSSRLQNTQEATLK